MFILFDIMGIFLMFNKQ